MMKRIALVTAFASMFIFAAVDAEAQRGRGRGHGPHGNKDRGAKLLRHADELQLSDEQIQRIRSFHQAARAQSEPLREDLKLMREEKRELMRAPVVDEAAVMRLVDEMAPLKDALAKNRTETRIKIHRVLTPEQREQLWQIREARRQMRGQGRGRFNCWRTQN